MKKWIVLWIIVILVRLVPISVSADEGVVIISPDGSDTSGIEEMKLNTPIEIPDYGQIALTSFEILDYIKCDDCKGQTGSSKEADYIALRFDILNLAKLAIDYTQVLSARAIYKDDYEFECFIGQYDYDNSENYYVSSFEILPFYKGHYIIHCMFPNAIIEDKTGSLQINFSLGENKFTYNTRK